ncbi:dihydrolipoamide acetyltransferase family protein [Nocardioides terrisoli]|uniref:dihydrolipoamide acetyltransferase family protein n=1 Tax=Nocardioides terrisoli TaxID=3388267 RepID=UPI00287BA447|nr:dihydrolipoamide acetyltransferase family protein [Nocardioides marmorisolisilvae]
MADYLLPDVGEGLTEAEIVSWKVKVGDEIKVNDIVVEIETAKSLVELPSPYAGTVLALLVEEGQTVEVGTPIISVGAAGEAPTAAPAPARGDHSDIDLSNPAASGSAEGESLVGRMKADRAAVRRTRRHTAAEAAGRHTARADVQDVFNAGAPHQHDKVAGIVEALTDDAVAQGGVDLRVGEGVPATGEAPTSTGPRTLAKPPVRKLAKDLGVDLTTVTPSGPDGVISREDVQSAAGGDTRQAMPAQYADLGRRGVAAMSGARETREPIKGVRKMMGQAMVDSAFSAPHVTEWITVDVTPTMELVERLKARRELGDLKVTPLLVLARACILAMRRTPEINSWWDEAAQEVVYKGYVNLGIAAATPRGLVVPNIKDADAMSLVELAAALGELVETARAGRTQPAEMSGGTFTITNVGPFGVDGGTPIINPGESAILCFGATKRQPWVVPSTGSARSGGAEERIEIRDVCTLALSFDHRHIDGQLGSRFLADVAGIMADPARALLF